jgi:ABC transporter substrate binding protein (PQQ-dependent alcohol dehydrogenase system)
MGKAFRVASLLFLLAAAWPGTPRAEAFVFAYIGIADDPYYRAERRYTGLVLKQPHPPLPGAKVGLRDSHIIGRALGVEFKLVERFLPDDGPGGADVAAAIESMQKESGARAFLLDLPAARLRAVAEKLAHAPVLLFNIRSLDDELRNAACAPNLYHVAPSHRMLTDALAQYLFKKGWTKVLMLRGPGTADAAYADAFVASARRLRIEIVADREFELTNDPRKRDESNVALLTGGPDYDAIFIADRDGEFGRYVAYQSYLPRPLIGDQGLSPAAWHWTWERHGAPQLNQRFARIEKDRHMAGADWAAWIAVRSVVAAIRKTGSAEPARLHGFLTASDTTLDGYKGTPSSFRAWNNQLRQPILLHTHNAVIARAPIEGFLHRTNHLDTLGYDRRESTCALAE